MNIAFVSIAHRHAEMYFRRLKTLLVDRSVYAIWDENGLRGRAAASREGAVFYESLYDLLKDESVDGFVICSENLKLLPLLKKVIAVGKPVFCEKPIVVGESDLVEFEVLRAKYATPLISGYFQPYLGVARAVSGLCQSGALGEIKCIRYRNTRPAATERWFDDPEHKWFVDPALSGGGGFLDLGSHAIHFVRSIFGPIRRIKATIGNSSGVYPLVDDFGVARLEFESGVLGEIEAGWLQAGEAQGLEVIGTEKRIWNTDAGYVIGESRKSFQCIEALEDEPVRMDRLIAVIRGESVGDRLAGDLSICCDTVRLVNASYRSSKEGEWLDMA